MSKLTHQQHIDAYNTVEYILKKVYGIPTEEAKKTLSYEKVVKFLPPEPTSTMAEIEWEYDKHYLAEAKHPEYGKVIMTVESYNGKIWILLQQDGIVGFLSTDSQLLTPTGRCYKLAEAQE